MARRWGHEPRLELQTLPVWHVFTTVDHLIHSPHCSMAKTADLLGLRPVWTGLETVKDAVAWLAADGSCRRSWRSARAPSPR